MFGPFVLKGPFIMQKWLKASIATFVSFAWVGLAHAFEVKDTGLYESAGTVYKDQKTLDLGSYLAKYVVSPLFAISGVIFLVFMLYAGILWMTDQGDADAVSKAKKILVHSVIGLIIMMSAYAITNLVLNAVTGSTLSNG
jgi:uncharacterized membrane protein